jgi:hypothetical protein
MGRIADVPPRLKFCCTVSRPVRWNSRTAASRRCLRALSCFGGSAVCQA